MEHYHPDEEFERRLNDLVRPLLAKARPGDWEHTRRTLKYAKYLLDHEPGERDLVITTLYLHDIGWSRVQFSDFLNAPVTQKPQTQSAVLHQKYGAIMAGEILRELDRPEEMVQRITNIIAIHDQPEKVFALGDPSATLVVEADRLDRFGPESLQRFTAYFGRDYVQGAGEKSGLEYLKSGLGLWFITPTAKSLSFELAQASGLFK
ncbi:MAG: HD domain-containing protein [Deltaproteobacteria bacterium]|nr:HD domain-containing protein [Deltaproteobacteria bacterium]